jgi:hypothetical protein
MPQQAPETMPQQAPATMNEDEERGGSDPRRLPPPAQQIHWPAERRAGQQQGRGVALGARTCGSIVKRPRSTAGGGHISRVRREAHAGAASSAQCGEATLYARRLGAEVVNRSAWRLGASNHHANTQKILVEVRRLHLASLHAVGAVGIRGARSSSEQPTEHESELDHQGHDVAMALLDGPLVGPPPPRWGGRQERGGEGAKGQGGR